MLNKIKDSYLNDKTTFMKRAVIGTCVGVTALCAFPYLIAGAGLALGFWFGRKAIGQLDK